jgi:peptidoglycan/LPS O-acetylase OafA/YrhL
MECKAAKNGCQFYFVWWLFWWLLRLRVPRNIYIVSYFGAAWADQALMLTLPPTVRPEKVYNAAKFETGITGEKP